MEQSVPKRRHTKFRRRGIIQKKAYNNLNRTDQNLLHYLTILFLSQIIFVHILLYPFQFIIQRYHTFWWYINHTFERTLLKPHEKWVPVTTVWRILRLRMEERPPIWRVAANILN